MVSLVFSIIAKTASQKSPRIEINARTVVQPTVWYTCPAGKVAKVQGSVQCTGRGAAATANFRVSSIIVFTWDRATIAVADYVTNPLFLTTQGAQMALFDVTLSAGQTIDTTQNSGTNAEFNVIASVEELPA